MNTPLTTIELTPRSEVPRASVIWLHGLGADGNDFLPLVEQTRWVETYNARFIFPHAPMRVITINQGLKIRGWYDIADLDLSSREDKSGIQASACSIVALIEREQALGIPSHKIVIAGFSQGGAMALQVGLRFPEPLAGVIALSCYLPLSDTFDERSVANQSLPIFMAHGTFDPIIPLALGESSRARLIGAGYRVEWKMYPMAHAVVPQEIAAIELFLGNVL